jgi:hypothetical protein
MHRRQFALCRAFRLLPTGATVRAMRARMALVAQAGDRIARLQCLDRDPQHRSPLSGSPGSTKKTARVLGIPGRVEEVAA